MRFLFLKTVIVFMVSTFSGYGQSDFPNAIPPSPTATAMQQYGNTNVSLYTGAVNVSIPIHTIKLKELEFPIVLNYTGSGGINTQQIASWVGIGWTLNATGAISRTIYGLADDLPDYGYLSQPAIPPAQHDGTVFTNVQVFLDFGGGRTDGAPDKYFYNANGISGTFYINKQKQVIQVPLTNNKIVPKFNGSKIVAFELITDKGVIYRFNEHEEVISYTPGGSSSNLTYQTSSWYLTSIQNHNKTDSIHFHYEDYHTLQYSEAFTTYVNENPSGIPGISATETNAKRLKYITYNDIGVVEFITGDIPRRDFNNEEFLASVKIDENDKKRFVDFSYSYFDQNGVVPLTSPYTTTNTYLTGYLINGQADGDHFKRLKLDSVNFFNDDRSISHPYTFNYYSDAWLPSRFSYARDHWGFYNGKNGNPGLEPRRTIDRRCIISHLRGEDFRVVGNADREPSAVYAKAGMLTRVTYPTGGWTEYEYELHQTSCKSLPNDKEARTSLLSPNILIDTIHIETYLEPSVELTVKIMAQLAASCDFAVHFRNIQTNALTGLTDFNEIDSNSRTIFLTSGDYEISYEALDGVGTCFDFYSIKFSWDQEVITQNKNVGGLRISRVTDFSGAGSHVTRLYQYINPSSGFSSGSIASVPRYGHYDRVSYQDSTNVMREYYRMYSTNMPLALTHGSQVGYNYVEVTTDEPNKTGKTAYYYTSPMEFPDFTLGWFLNKYDDRFELPDGNMETISPFPLADIRDWKRGMLYAQEDFEYNNGQFVRIMRKENFYKIYGETNESFDSESQLQYPLGAQIPAALVYVVNDEAGGDGIPKILGVRAECAGACVDGVIFKFYEYFSGRIELEAEVNKTFQGQHELTSTTNYFYQNSVYFYPAKIQTSTSLIDSITTILKYPFDHASLANLSTGHKAALDSLVRRNVVATAVEKTIKRGSFEVERQLTNFIFNDPLVSVDNIFSSKSGLPLAQELDFTEYDAKGNLLEYKGRDGISVAINYGYADQFPVAKVIDAHSNEIYYESFEETGITGSSKTGKKYHLGDYTIVLPTANANSILSYWYWENDAWHYKQIPYSGGNYLVTDGERIDEVRIYPKGALMTTYTYSPGIGLTSVTDQNNQTTTYEYDSFGRLSLVKDHQGNIIQHTRYHITNALTY